MTLPPVDMPPLAVAGFQELTEDQKALFVAEYSGRKRNLALMVGLAILFPIQLFFLGKIGLGIIFLPHRGGLGIWYVIEWFLTPGRVRAYNTRAANEIVAALQRSA
jgi:hypothetical protein